MICFFSIATYVYNNFYFVSTHMYECMIDFVYTNLYFICVATDVYNRFYFLTTFIFMTSCI